MKPLIVFFLFSHSCMICTFAGDVCEDKSLDSIYWLCEANKDGTVNVTYDCLNAEKLVEIWIWSEKLPTDLNTLTIQNCKMLNLNLLKNSDRSVGDFRLLNVLNISELTIFPSCNDQHHCNPNRCVPSNVIFTNITVKTLDAYLSRNDYCDSQGTTLKSLLLKNVSVGTMKTNFISSTNLRHLVMDGVKIKFAENNALNIANKKGAIKIISSEIEQIEGNFISCKVFEVTISNNNIQHFNEKFYIRDKVFVLEADKIILNGNRMKILSDNTFNIVSNNIEITNNIFHRVDEKAFDNIAPTKPAANSSPVISNFFNFSNNEIYSLAPGALMIPVQNKSRNALFTNITIFNNSVNCVCENMFWFESVSQNKNNVRNYFNYKWAKKTNQNKCLNLSKCDVSQVLNNYHELCEDPYKCPEMIISEGKEKVLNFINYNNEMGRETSKLLEMLVNQMEESKIFKDSDKSNQESYFESLIKKNQIQEEQKWMNILNLNQISSCLLIITCLSCGALGYILISKCLASSFLQTLTSKYRPRSFLTETEMNPSCISEFN